MTIPAFVLLAECPPKNRNGSIDFETVKWASSLRVKYAMGNSRIRTNKTALSEYRIKCDH